MRKSNAHVIRLLAAIATATTIAGCGGAADTAAPASSDASIVAGASDTTSAIEVDVPTTTSLAPATTAAALGGTSTTADAPVLSPSTTAAPEGTSTTAAAPVLPPDPVPAEGTTAVAILRWELGPNGGCPFLEFADARRVTFESLGFEGLTHSSDGTGEALVTYDGVEIWTGSSVVVESRGVFPPAEDMGCGANFDHLLVIESLRPT